MRISEEILRRNGIYNSDSGMDLYEADENDDEDGLETISFRRKRRGASPVCYYSNALQRVIKPIYSTTSGSPSGGSSLSIDLYEPDENNDEDGLETDSQNSNFWFLNQVMKIKIGCTRKSYQGLM